MSVGETVTHDHKTYPPESARPGRSSVRKHASVKKIQHVNRSHISAPETGALRQYRNACRGILPALLESARPGRSRVRKKASARRLQHVNRSNVAAPETGAL